MDYYYYKRKPVMSYPKKIRGTS